MTISVLIVDDHAVFAETLALALSRLDGIRISGTATTAHDALILAKEDEPDLALVDLKLPDVGGIELTRRLRTASPRTRVIILTASTDAGSFARAVVEGVSGYLTKDAGLMEVAEAVRAACAGQVVVPEHVLGRLFSAAGSAPEIALTKRETEVLVLLAGGCDARRIAGLLGITWNTARTYVKNILSKLNAHSQVEAVMTAIRLGIITARSEVDR